MLRHGFFHGLGHGVGLEVHEGPYMGLLPDGALRAGDVVTLEPGLYDPAVGGVRLEDLVLVTDDGCEVLTRFPYDLEVSRAMSEHTIHTLSDEDRRFPPPAGVRGAGERAAPRSTTSRSRPSGSATAASA